MAMSSKVKKQKTMEELLEEALVPEEEQPYKVPSNWVFVKFGAIANGKHGYAFKSKEYSETGIPIIRMGNVVGSNEVILNEEKLVYINRERIDEFSNVIVEKHDILMSLTDLAAKGEFLGTVAYYAHDESALLNQRLLKIISNPNKIDRRFMFFSLKSPYFRKYVTQPAGGSIQKNISSAFVLDYDFPLPPLNEQKQIADKVECLLNKIDEAKQLIKEAKETFELRRTAILEKAFRGKLTAKWRSEHPVMETAEVLIEKIQKELSNKSTKKKEIMLNNLIEAPFELPIGWKWVTLGDVINITSGGTPKRSINEYYDGEIPWVKTGELKWNYISESVEHISANGINNSSAKLLPPKTVLVAMYGQGKTRGRAAILNIEASCNQAVCALLPNKYISEKLLFYYFMEGYHRFRKIAKGGNQENLSATMISKFLFPLSPLEEQSILIKTIDNLLNNEINIYNFIDLDEQLETIKQSILSKAFRGELGTNDPTEESAMELLKKVLQEKLQ
jgi:type I restriction enzyme, S subunit